MESYRILVVDDDEAIRLTITDLLEIEGYAVTTAADGEQALRAIQQERPDLILLDMRLPNMDGWEFATELRQRGIPPPILVITAAPNAGQWAAEIQAQGCIAKPFEYDELISLIEHFCPRAAREI